MFRLCTWGSRRAGVTKPPGTGRADWCPPLCSLTFHLLVCKGESSAAALEPPSSSPAHLALLGIKHGKWSNSFSRSPAPQVCSHFPRHQGIPMAYPSPPASLGRAHPIREAASVAYAKSQLSKTDKSLQYEITIPGDNTEREKLAKNLANTYKLLGRWKSKVCGAVFAANQPVLLPAAMQNLPSSEPRSAQCIRVLRHPPRLGEVLPLSCL